MGIETLALAVVLAAPAAAAPGPERATVVVMPTEGSPGQVRGVVKFVRATPSGLKVTGQVTGLTPGPHGLHVHQWGDCSAPNGSSAGDHFNPRAKAHGAPGMAMHHAGDLGNVIADEGGTAVISLVMPDLALVGEDGILGRALIVHAKADDLKTPPSGNSGERLACGVVGIENPSPAPPGPVASPKP